MSVNHEVKGMLAKLLATEDIVVEHKKVSTACFNVHTRVLTLPLWEKASNNVYDLLVAHECGHSIFTPDEDWSETCKVPQQFINVVEDARIEKLMKRKYMGLAKTFFNGYKELNEEDFFQLDDEDISTFNLADRANLWFKVGNYINIPIERGEETEIINMIADAETFDDALNAAEALYKYCKKEKEQQQKVADFDSHQQQGSSTSASNEQVETEQSEEEQEQKVADFDSHQQQGSSTSASNEQVETEQSEEEQDGESTQPQQTEESGGAQGEQTSVSSAGGAQGEQTSVSSAGDEEEPEVRTADNLEDKIRDLVNDDGIENVYIEIPQVNLDTIIGKNADVHKDIDSCFAYQQTIQNETAEDRGYQPVNLFLNADTEFKKFKVSAQKEVNYLVKEFECRKAADSYSRSSTARTGVLDTTRLHTYKYNEDLFKKVSVIPDGKNHGLVFILDWSGSMSHVLLDTCKQLFNLIWFCKKVSIPFEVYAFTNEWRRGEYDYETKQSKPADRTPHYQKKEGLLVVDEQFSLMNILTSKVNGKELEHQMLNIWRIAVCFSDAYYAKYTHPNRLCLSGTPLNESLVALHQILPKFQKENKLQKVQCVVLTDGEANHLPYHVEVKRAWDKEPYIGVRGVSPHNTFLRDRKLGTTYKFDYGYHHYTDTLLRNLKDKFPTVNFIGIRVLCGRDANRFINLYHSHSDKQYDRIQSDWKKLKSFKITNSGYDAYFGLSSSALSQDSEFEVADDASKAQIKTAFVKSLKSKKMNKKVLGDFISLVA